MTTTQALNGVSFEEADLILRPLQRDGSMIGQPLFLCRYGSHLYGTATEDSDTDWKGVFMPSARSMLLGEIPKTARASSGDAHEKNAPGDVDVEWFSLHYFLELAIQGQTIALDCLHVREDQAEIWEPAWQQLFERRSDFYTRNLQAFVGYARRQAAKYGIKGSRLEAVRRVLRAIGPYDDHNCSLLRLSSIWDDLPTGEHIYKEPLAGKVATYEVCGKKLISTEKVHHAIACLDRFEHHYGERARQAATNDGIDWKAISHACRAAIEVAYLLRDGDLSFPLPEAPHLLAIKRGEWDYQSEAAPYLEQHMELCERLSAESTLPLKVDRRAFRRWLLEWTALTAAEAMPLLLLRPEFVPGIGGVAFLESEEDC